ncbi:MAG TPA: MFS transporter [Gammaproteobacteria bacterium]|nr:MFS transporter [Gammaproteobacteria bacterium]HRA42448.1 MFS transporter [Gammaproteobacteria bacterium]
MRIEKKSLKVMLAGAIGGSIEFYDFVLYGALAPLFSKLFFPSEEAFVSLLSAYAVFAVGFFARPLGAIIFGSVGDKYGRRVALFSSLILMSIATLSIGVLPTYNTIGIFAPLLMLLIRLMQGISAGGEYSGALIFAIEHNDKKRSGLVGSFVAAGCMSGLVLGSIAGLVCALPNMPVWVWRVPFIIGFAVSALGIYIRYNLEETPEFIAQKNETTEKISFWQEIIHNPLQFFSAIVLSGFNGIVLYVYFVFLSPFITQATGLSMTMSKLYTCLGTACIMVLLVFFGWLSDFVDRVKLMTAAIIFLIGTSFMMFMTLEEVSYSTILVYQLLFVCFFAMYSGPLNTYIIELFKTMVRYRCAAVGYSLGMGIIGGSAPFVATLFTLNEKSAFFLSCYIGAWGIVAMLALFSLALQYKKNPYKFPTSFSI